MHTGAVTQFLSKNSFSRFSAWIFAPKNANPRKEWNIWNNFSTMYMISNYSNASTSTTFENTKLLKNRSKDVQFQANFEITQCTKIIQKVSFYKIASDVRKVFYLNFGWLLDFSSFTFTTDKNSIFMSHFNYRKIISVE